MNLKHYFFLSLLLCFGVGEIAAQIVDRRETIRSMGNLGRAYLNQKKKTEQTATPTINERNQTIVHIKKDTVQSIVELNSDVDTNIPITETSNDCMFVVIIANENYQEEVPVKYALNDGEAFKRYCRQTLGIPEKNIHVRKDATLNHILFEIEWMQKVAVAYEDNAGFIFYYAGHGFPDESEKSSYLLPIDGRGSMPATSYKLETLYREIGNLPSKQTVVFLDACFSGSKRGEGMLTAARGVAIKVKEAAPQGNIVVLSASQEDETAYPYEEKHHGIFTYYLLKKLQETQGGISLGELSNYIINEVRRNSIILNGKMQTPIVSTKINDEWKAWTLK